MYVFTRTPYLLLFLLLLNLERINVDIIPSIEAVPGHWTQYFVQHLERA